MKQQLVNFLKYNKIAYSAYYMIMSFCINLLKLFVKTDDKLIIFNSFAGRKYDDSPKAIFRQMRKDERFKEYHLVWALHEPDKFRIKGAKKIKTDTIGYFFSVLKARMWITNSSFERGLDFTGKNTLYFNTWHGTPMKKMGTDIAFDNNSFRKSGKNHFDIMMSQGDYETEIFSHAFMIHQNKFLKAGLPRNDILAHYTEEQRIAVKKKLGLVDTRKVILYCPTFREYDKDKNLGVVMSPPMDLKKWEEKLGEEYILLVRAHYEVAKVMNIEENSFVRNMTEYPTLNHLLIATDILISDYSSVFFDYSITGKPMLHFCYDYDTYEKSRGLYFDIRKEIDGAETEDKLITVIKSMDMKYMSEKTKQFRDKYVNYYGNATHKAVDLIADMLNK